MYFWAKIDIFSNRIHLPSSSFQFYFFPPTTTFLFLSVLRWLERNEWYQILCEPSIYLKHDIIHNEVEFILFRTTTIK